MSGVDVVRFSELSINAATSYIIEMKVIFFSTAIKKEFETPLQKEKYYKIWLGFYLDHYPEFALLAVLDHRCVGYIVGVPDSASEKYFFKTNSAYVVFSDLYDQYPAHLHINCHPDFQGKGIGPILIESFIDVLSQKGIDGVHIITTKSAGNVAFYRKLGFSFQKIRTIKNKELLFMARCL